MSRLRELIAELCPDGVEYKALNELFDIRNGYTPSKKNPAFWDDGVHPWFVMEDIRRDGTVLTESAAHITDAALKKNGLFPANSIIVATSATIGVHALVTVDFLCNQRFACMTIKQTYADKLDIRYVHQVFFALDRWCLEHVDQGNFATVNSAALRAYRIPVPPIEVQREIVRILDSFQEFDDALTAEIEAREKQLGHYRDLLISNRNNAVFPLTTIASVTKLAGYEFTNHVVFSDSGSIIALRGLNVKNGKLCLSDIKYIDNSNFEKLKRSKLYIDDLLFTYIGTIGSVALIDEDDRYYLAPNVARIRCSEVMLPRYLYWVFQSDFIQHVQIGKYLSNSTLKNLTMANIRQFDIPLPSLDEQKRVISVLDTMRQCIDSVIEEQNSRRKQFEYYRDKLLSFPEKVS